MATYILLAPVVFLLLGAILILFLGEERPAEGWDPLPPSITGLAFVASLLLRDELPVRVALSRWRPLSQFRAELVYYADGLALPFLLLMTLLGLAAILSSLDRPLRGPEKNRLYAASFFLTAAGLSLVLSANLITLCLSWVLLDLGIFLVINLQGGDGPPLPAAIRALATNGVAGMALLAAALMVSQSEASLVLVRGVVPLLALSLLALAALVRMGLYPAHLGLPATEGRLWANALYRLIPASAGVYLLVRAYSLARGPLPVEDTLLLLGSLAVVASAILAWGEKRVNGILSWVAINQVSYVVLAMGLGTPQMAIVALLQAVNLVLALGIFFLSQGMAEGAPSRLHALGVQALRTVAVASLLGLPLTLGFWVRWGFYRQAVEGGAWPLVLLSAVASALLLPPLMASLRSAPSRPGRLTETGWAGLGLLALPLVLLGLQPLLLMPLVRPVGGAASRPYLGQLIPSTYPLLGLEIVAAILLPLLAGYGLYRAWQAFAERGEVLVQAICTALDLAWLYRLLWRGILRLGAALQGLAAFTEGKYALAWVVLLALVVVLLILGA
ncbi:MAG: proton-conducting transporter membrane subunit [Anaerolineae bacterium]